MPKDYYLDWIKKQEAGMNKLSEIDYSLMTEEELEALIKKLKQQKNAKKK